MTGGKLMWLQPLCEMSTQKPAEAFAIPQWNECMWLLYKLLPQRVADSDTNQVSAKDQTTTK